MNITNYIIYHKDNPTENIQTELDADFFFGQKQYISSVWRKDEETKKSNQ